MPKQKRRMRVTLNIDEWVWLRELADEYVYDEQDSDEPLMAERLEKARKIVDALTSHIDDFYDLH